MRFTPKFITFALCPIEPKRKLKLIAIKLTQLNVRNVFGLVF